MTLLADGQRLIQEQFAAVPEHKRGALVAIADLDGVKLGVAARFGDDWKLAAKQTQQFRYRLLVYRGSATREQLAHRFEHFGAGSAVSEQARP